LITILPADYAANHFPLGQVTSALTRLVSAMKTASHACDSDLLLRWEEELATLSRSAQTIKSSAILDQRLIDLRTWLISFRSMLCEQSALGASGTDRLWLQLGLELANGHSVGSQGRLMNRPPQGSRHYSTLEFVDSTPHRWRCQNEELVTATLTQLDIEREDVFSDTSNCDQGLVFDDLPLEIAWGWCRIESAMESLSQRLAPPVWDSDQRALSVRGVEVRKYRNPAANQTRILEEFQSREWSSRIENPFTDERTLNLTVCDLNRTISPPLIEFFCDGSSRVGWRFAATATGSA
jgi:hypothetical protein